MRRTEGVQQCGKREMRDEDDQDLLRTYAGNGQRIKTRKNGCLDKTNHWVWAAVSWRTSLVPAIGIGQQSVVAYFPGTSYTTRQTCPVSIAFSLSARKSRLPILMGIPLDNLKLMGFSFGFSVGTHHRDKPL